MRYQRPISTYSSKSRYLIALSVVASHISFSHNIRPLYTKPHDTDVSKCMYIIGTDASYLHVTHTLELPRGRVLHTPYRITNLRYAKTYLHVTIYPATMY